MKTKEQYPITMTAKEVAEVLGISQRKAYELMEEKGFPAFKVGRHKKVNREAFFRWMENPAAS